MTAAANEAPTPQAVRQGALGDGRLTRIEVGVLLAIVVLAALLRLPGLEARGAWDADQGQDMLVLGALARDGEVPLLGPRTSVGTFHHGAAYYYLLAPSALLSGADPVAVTGEIALFGVGAVAAAWWLGRLVGGPLAAAAAALLAAVSPAGIDESTFIWNPNLIPFASGVAFAAAIAAWRTGHARWWLLAAAGAMVTMQCHVLGVLVLPALAIGYLADARRRRRARRPLRPLALAGAGALVIVAAGYLPLVAHELTHDFGETRAILDYLGGSGREAAGGLLDRIAMVGLRAIAWPLAGLVTDRPTASLVAWLAVAGLAALAAITGRRDDRLAARWLLGTLAWSVVALAVVAPSLAVVVPGLPNDHYHAFLDPLVLALVGAGLARLATTDRTSTAARTVARVAAAAILGGLVAIGITAWPPAVSPDGGWRLADEAAGRVLRITGDRPFGLDGIPPFKSANALRFPLEHRGADPLPAEALAGAGAPPAAVVVCDPLFEEVVGLACGGPAEAAWAGDVGLALPLADRFEAGPRRVISVYAAP